MTQKDNKCDGCKRIDAKRKLNIPILDTDVYTCSCPLTDEEIDEIATEITEEELFYHIQQEE